MDKHMEREIEEVANSLLRRDGIGQMLIIGGDTITTAESIRTLTVQTPMVRDYLGDRCIVVRVKVNAFTPTEEIIEAQIRTGLLDHLGVLANGDRSEGLKLLGSTLREELRTRWQSALGRARSDEELRARSLRDAEKHTAIIDAAGLLARGAGLISSARQESVGGREIYWARYRTAASIALMCSQIDHQPTRIDAMVRSLGEAQIKDSIVVLAPFIRTANRGKYGRIENNTQQALSEYIRCVYPDLMRIAGFYASNSLDPLARVAEECLETRTTTKGFFATLSELGMTGHWELAADMYHDILDIAGAWRRQLRLADAMVCHGLEGYAAAEMSMAIMRSKRSDHTAAHLLDLYAKGTLYDALRRDEDHPDYWKLLEPALEQFYLMRGRQSVLESM